MLIISARPSARLAGGWALHSGVLSPGTMAVLRHTCGDTSHPHNNAAPRDPGMWQIADIMQRDGEMGQYSTCGHMVVMVPH